VAPGQSSAMGWVWMPGGSAMSGCARILPPGVSAAMARSRLTRRAGSALRLQHASVWPVRTAG